MGDVTDEAIDGWVAAVGQLHDTVADDPGDARAAEQAMAGIWSEFGFQEAPTHVLRMLVQATEVGYTAALRDVRDGALDEEIRSWRPDLMQP